MNCQIATYKRAKVEQGRIIPEELINEVRQILADFGAINIRSFTQVYHIVYQRVFPLKSLKLDNGVCGFFQLIGDVVIATKLPRNNTMLSLREELVTRHQVLVDSQNMLMERYQHALERHKNLFNPCNGIWTEWTQLLNKKSYQIVPSPYQAACKNNYRDLIYDIVRIEMIFQRNPFGIPMHELGSKLGIVKRDFKVVSIDQLVRTWTELFFIKEPTGYHQNPLVFSGRTTTYDFEQELLKAQKQRDGTRHSLERIVFDFIKSGLYQKTLLLLYEAKNEGLRLNVWRETIRLNFLKNCGKPKEDYYDRLKKNPEAKASDNNDENIALAGKNIIGIFYALHITGLLTLTSHQQRKNDLRIYLPLDPSFSFEDVMIKICQKYQKQLEIDKINSKVNGNDSVMMEDCENDPPSVS